MRLSRSRVKASSGLFDGRSLATTLTRYDPEGNAVVSQAYVFSVIGVSVSRDPVGPALLADRERETQVVVVGVGRLPAEVEPGLAGRAVGGAHVGNVEPGDLGREVGRPDS